MNYHDFLLSKVALAEDSGFDISQSEINPILKPHQKDAVQWAIKGGRRALFEAFGLGKTIQELEWCRIITEKQGGQALIVLPLGVKQEFTQDAVNLLKMKQPEYVRNMAEVKAAKGKILLTNYERIRDGDINPTYFVATSLDEASCLRSYGSKTYQTFLDKFKGVPYKLVSTATPSPNKYKELIHYAGYLEVMDTGQALTRFFQRDSTKANNLTLYPHKENEFWLWMSSWALFITKPSDLGYDDTGYELPPIKINYHEIPVDNLSGEIEKDGQYKLIKDAAVSLADAAREKRDSINGRVAKMVEIVRESLADHFILWHDLEAERHYAETERQILKVLLEKWKQHNYLTDKMTEIIKKYGLHNTSLAEKMARSMGVERVQVKGKNYTIVNNDCILETAQMPENSIDLIITSIPFSNHYEYTPSYNDFGHNQDTNKFFDQMDFLSPNLLKVLRPGRVFACHVKDRVLFGNATGTGMPTIEPFHALCIDHYIKHGFQYFGMITVVTDVVRENNQTYRLGWSEQCKDGTKMGVGCPEYILLFRKLPSDTSKAYADVPVKKTKQEYTRAQWQIDAHGYWRSSGNRLLSKDELLSIPVENLQAVYRKYSRENIYDYEQHIALAKKLDQNGKLPASFMVVAPGSWHEEVWDDINRMKTLNTSQSRKRKQMHECPLQIDIVERIINRYSNPGDIAFDPFGGLMTVPVTAVKMGRRGYAIELNSDYFRDGLGYLKTADAQREEPTLFGFLEAGA